jgi:hypothetical protein
MLTLVDPNDITITYNKAYFDFDSTSINPPETIGIDSAALFRTLFRIMEFGCLNWGVRFKRYSLRVGHAIYVSNVRNINCNGEEIFALEGDVFSPDEMRPIDIGVFSSSYDEIKTFYIPLMYLNTIGGQLGIYPDELLETHAKLLHQRGLFLTPSIWLNSRERRNNLTVPYSFGQTVYYQDNSKSYISLIDDNVVPPEDTLAWKEIKYHRPLENSLVPSYLNNPVEDLLNLFEKTFDLSTLQS